MNENTASTDSPDPESMSFEMVAVKPIEQAGVQYQPGDPIIVVGISRMRWLRDVATAAVDAAEYAQAKKDGQSAEANQTAGTPNERTESSPATAAAKPRR